MSVCVCVCVCVCAFMFVYVYYQSKEFGHLQKLFFLILKALFIMEQVKHHNVFYLLY